MQLLDKLVIGARTVLCLLITAALTLTGCNSGQGSFQVQNSAREEITLARVAISSEDFLFQEIYPSEETEPTFYRVGADSSFVVTIKFASGQELRAKGGYITNGLDLSHKIIVKDNEVLFELLE